MKVLIGTPTDRVVEKKPLIAGLVQRYRRTPTPTGVEMPIPTLRVEDRRAELVHFYRLYEEFVESLCDGAQLGVSPKFENAYLSSREKLVLMYSNLRPFLGAYLRPSPDDMRDLGPGIKFDAFDALLSPPTLGMFLQTDDGNTISRITRTREALNLYNEHLRQLAEKTK